MTQKLSLIIDLMVDGMTLEQAEKEADKAMAEL